MKWKMLITTHSFFRFLLVGCISTAAQYIFLITSIELNVLEHQVAVILAYLTGAFVNYTLNKWYTFETRIPHYTAVPKFLIMISTGMLFNSLTFNFFWKIIGLNYIVSQVSATIILIIFNYLVSRLWVFREKI